MKRGVKRQILRRLPPPPPPALQSQAEAPARQVIVPESRDFRETSVQGTTPKTIEKRKNPTHSQSNKEGCKSGKCRELKDHSKTSRERLSGEDLNVGRQVIQRFRIVSK